MWRHLHAVDDRKRIIIIFSCLYVSARFCARGQGYKSTGRPRASTPTRGFSVHPSVVCLPEGARYFFTRARGHRTRVRHYCTLKFIVMYIQNRTVYTIVRDIGLSTKFLNHDLKFYYLTLCRKTVGAESHFDSNLLYVTFLVLAQYKRVLDQYNHVLAQYCIYWINIRL